jgi:hypothetical protein
MFRGRSGKIDSRGRAVVPAYPVPARATTNDDDDDDDEARGREREGKRTTTKSAAAILPTLHPAPRGRTEGSRPSTSRENPQEETKR